MKYTILYDYNWYELGCSCCTESTSELKIYDEHGHKVYENTAPFIYDEEELKAFVNKALPAYNNFTVHLDTYYP